MYWLKKKKKKTPGCNYTQNCKDVSFKRVIDLNHENRAPTNLANIGHQRKILNLVLKKRYSFFKDFLKENDNCLVLLLSIATQLSKN